MDFLDRLHLLLDGRRKYSWGNDLGLGRGAIESMFKGAVPTWQTLSAIRRAENVAPEWLVDGFGAPYYVTRCSSDDECAELLALHLADEMWNAVLVTDHATLLVVLWQPATYTLTPKEGAPIEVAYRAVEVIAGGGTQTARAVRDRCHGSIALEQMSSARMSQILRGEVGTWRLFLAPDAWLRNTRPISRDHVIFDWPEAEMRLSLDERAVVEKYRSMCPDQRTHFQAVAQALAQPKADYKVGK